LLQETRLALCSKDISKTCIWQHATSCYPRDIRDRNVISELLPVKTSYMKLTILRWIYIINIIIKTDIYIPPLTGKPEQGRPVYRPVVCSLTLFSFLEFDFAFYPFKTFLCVGLLLYEFRYKYINRCHRLFYL